MNPLKKHPFAVDAWFERVVAVSFAFPREGLIPLVPGELEIDSFNGFGFVTAALVWTRSLRPAGFPRLLGQNFFLAGYRIFTRLRDSEGRSRRGLYIVRSETDKRSMVISGNLLTRYHYQRIELTCSTEHGVTHVTTRGADRKATLDLTYDACESAGLPDGSIFPDWQTARRFAGPLPFTFSRQNDGTFLVIEGRRANWNPRPVAVKSWRVGLFEEQAFSGLHPILANAFTVEGIPYRWEKGKTITPAAAV